MLRAASSLLVASFLLVAGCSSSTETPSSQSPSTGAPTDAPSETPPTADDGTSAPSATKACSDAPAGKVADVSVADLKALLDSGSTLAVVDVREPSETAEGTIEGALLYPWNSGVLEKKHADLPTDRPLYVICRSGSRSSAATAFLAEKGRACVHDVQGGMNAWTGASYPVAK